MARALPEVSAESIKASTERCRSLAYVDDHVIPAIPERIYDLMKAKDASMARELGNGWLEGAIIAYDAVQLECENTSRRSPDLTRIPASLISKVFEPERTQRRKAQQMLWGSQHPVMAQLESDDRKYFARNSAFDFGRDSMLYLLTFAARIGEREERQFERFLQGIDAEMDRDAVMPPSVQPTAYTPPPRDTDISEHLYKRRR